MVSSNDVQRLFLQATLSRRVMTREVALKLWEKCVDAVKGSLATFLTVHQEG